MSRLALVLISVLLGSCARDAETLTAGGATGAAGTGSGCLSMHTPEYAVKGKTNYDQAWINKTTESLVSGCSQPRPQIRPASFDAPPPTAAVQATTPEPTQDKQLAKRKRWFGF